jgi:hypothetical protein
MIGNIYKNRRSHPDQVFVVLQTRVVKSNTKPSVMRVKGILIVDGQAPLETSFLLADFNKTFPFLMWGPAA